MLLLSKKTLVALCFHLYLLAGCERSTDGPDPGDGQNGRDDATGAVSGVASSGGTPNDESGSGGEASGEGTGGGGTDAGSGGQAAACIVPLADPPAPPAASLEECPEDPDGRPEMPRGAVSFIDAPNAPRLEVELALTRAHQMHGLMYRPELSDQEGMLFTYSNEQILSFWMKNTCLSLDLLWIDEEGIITGIVRQIPPWNTESRSIPCPSAHVLEVRAGFTETYGVEPGQRIEIDGLP